MNTMTNGASQGKRHVCKDSFVHSSRTGTHFYVLVCGRGVLLLSQADVASSTEFSKNECQEQIMALHGGEPFLADVVRIRPSVDLSVYSFRK